MSGLMQIDTYVEGCFDAMEGVGGKFEMVQMEKNKEVGRKLSIGWTAEWNEEKYQDEEEEEEEEEDHGGMTKFDHDQYQQSISVTVKAGTEGVEEVKTKEEETKTMEYTENRIIKEVKNAKKDVTVKETSNEEEAVTDEDDTSFFQSSAVTHKSSDTDNERDWDTKMHRSYSADSHEMMYQPTDGRDMGTPDKSEAAMVRSRPMKRTSRMVQARTRSFEQSDEERAASAQGDSNRCVRKQTYRDTSWDKKWQEHLTQNQQTQKEEGLGSVYQTKQRRPGRLNRSYWENMAGVESRLPPRTPPPKRRLRESPAECPNGPCGNSSPRRKLRDSPFEHENRTGSWNSSPSEFLQNDLKSSQESLQINDIRNEEECTFRQNVIETEAKHEMKMTQLDATCSDNGSEHKITKEGQLQEVTMNADITNKATHEAKERHENKQSTYYSEKVETVLELSKVTSTNEVSLDKSEPTGNGMIPSETKVQQGKGDSDQSETARSPHLRHIALSPAMDDTLMDAVQDVSNKLSDAVLVMTDVAVKRPQETPPPPTPPSSPPPQGSRRLSYLPSPPPEIEDERRESFVSNASVILESKEDSNRSVPPPPQRSASFKCKTKAPGTPPVKRSGSDTHHKQRQASKTPEPQRKHKTPEPPQRKHQPTEPIKQNRASEPSHLIIDCQAPNLPLSRTPEPESPGTPSHRRKIIVRASKTPSPSPTPDVKIKVREELVRAKSMLSSKKVNMTAALEALEQAYQDLESVVGSEDERDETESLSERGRLTPRKKFIFGGSNSSIIRMGLEEHQEDLDKDSTETSGAKTPQQRKIKEEPSGVIHKTPLMFTPEPQAIEVTNKSMLKEETSRKKNHKHEEHFEHQMETSEKRTSRERFEETQTNDQLIRASGTFQAIPVTVDDTVDEREPYEIATDEMKENTSESECNTKAEQARKEVEKQVQFQKWKDEKIKQEESARLQSLKDKEMDMQNSKSTDVKHTVLSQEAIENKKMRTGRKDFMQSMLIKENQTATNEVRKAKLEELRAMEAEKRREEEKLIEELEKKRKDNKSPKVACPSFTSISCTTERRQHIQESELSQSTTKTEITKERKQVRDEKEEKYSEYKAKQEENNEVQIMKQKEAALRRERLIKEEVEQRERKKQQEELKQKLNEQKIEEERQILQKKQEYLKEQEEEKQRKILDEARRKEERNLEELQRKEEAAKLEIEKEKEKRRKMEEERWNEEVKLLEEANKKRELLEIENENIRKQQRLAETHHDEMKLNEPDISNKKLSYSSVETNSAIQFEELEDRSLIEDGVPNCLIETPKDEVQPFSFPAETIEEVEQGLTEREKVRLWEKELVMNGKRHESGLKTSETNLYQDHSYQGNNKENKFSMSGLLKDVNIGLVKNRANIFGKPETNQNISSVKSPRIKRKILQPSSWFKKDSTSESNGYVELIHDKNVQIASQKWEETKSNEPPPKINLNEDTSIQGNTEKKAAIYRNESPSHKDRDTFTPTHFIGDVMKDVKSDEKVHYHHNIIEQKEVEEFQKQVVLNDSVDSSKSEAPWRQSSTNDTDKSPKEVPVLSPSLSLVSFSITPSSTNKEINSDETNNTVNPEPKESKNKEDGSYLWQENWESVHDLEDFECEETVIQIQDCSSHQKTATQTSHTSESTTKVETSTEITRTFCTAADKQLAEILTLPTVQSEKQENNLSNLPNDSPQTVSKLRPTSPKEAVEELEKTIKQLEQHAENLGETVVNEDQAKSVKLSTSVQMVNAAAETVKDAAGAVREVAETLLRTMTPDIMDSKEIPKGTVKSTQNQYLIQSSPETRRKLNKSPQDLQDVQEAISGKVKSNQTMFNQNSPKTRRKANKSPQDLQDVKDVISGKVRNAQTILNSPETKRKAAGSPQDLQEVQDAISGKVKGTASMWQQIAQQHEQTEKVETISKGPSRRIGNMLKARNKTWSDDDMDSDEDSYGYEDDFSSGIDLPTEITSGNVTPIPTTGELEELSSIDEPTVIEDLPPSDKTEPESRTTPLKSLLKKPSFDADDSCSDSDSDDGKTSPKKVHFSEIDQVKLMSQESLASMANSEGSDATMPVTMCTTSITTTATPSRARIVQNKTRQEDNNNKNHLDVMEKALEDMKDRAEQSYFNFQTYGASQVPGVMSVSLEGTGSCMSHVAHETKTSVSHETKTSVKKGSSSIYKQVLPSLNTSL